MWVGSRYRKSILCCIHHIVARSWDLLHVVSCSWCRISQSVKVPPTIFIGRCTLQFLTGCAIQPHNCTHNRTSQRILLESFYIPQFIIGNATAAVHRRWRTIEHNTIDGRVQLVFIVIRGTDLFHIVGSIGQVRKAEGTICSGFNRLHWIPSTVCIRPDSHCSSSQAAIRLTGHLLACDLSGHGWFWEAIGIVTEIDKFYNTVSCQRHRCRSTGSRLCYRPLQDNIWQDESRRGLGLLNGKRAQWQVDIYSIYPNANWTRLTLQSISCKPD